MTNEASCELVHLTYIHYTLQTSGANGSSEPSAHFLSMEAFGLTFSLYTACVNQLVQFIMKYEACKSMVYDLSNRTIDET